MDDSVKNTRGWCTLKDPIQYLTAAAMAGRISYNNRLDYAVLADGSWVGSQPFSVKIGTNTYYNITYLLKDVNGDTVAEEKCGLSVVYYQVPPSYLSLYLQDSITRTNDQSLFVMLSASDLTSNSTGHVTFSYQPVTEQSDRFKVKKQYPGRWAMGFRLQNVYTIPITFTTNFEITSISIVTEPEVAFSPYPTGRPLTTPVHVFVLRVCVATRQGHHGLRALLRIRGGCHGRGR